MTRIKVCGMMTREDILLCVSAGVHALGFVVEYPLDVPWNLDRKTAAELMQSVPPFVSRVIVVGDSLPEVIRSTEILKPHVVQLHGSEPLPATAELAAAIRERGAQVIKALRFSVETGGCCSTGEDPIDAARRIEDTGVDALVLDSVSETRPGGTGRSMDWGIARKIRRSVRIPVILAGGLHPGNVGRAIAAADPYGVDVISGVENPVGRKDREKLNSFIRAVANAPRRGAL